MWVLVNVAGDQSCVASFLCRALVYGLVGVVSAWVVDQFTRELGGRKARSIFLVGRCVAMVF